MKGYKKLERLRESTLWYQTSPLGHRTIQTTEMCPWQREQVLHRGNKLYQLFIHPSAPLEPPVNINYNI